MNISIKSFFLLATVLSLSGCVSDEVMTGSTDEAPAVHGSDRYPITVVRGPRVIEIDTRKGYLSADEGNAVRAFVHQAQSNAVTPIVISRPAANGGPAFHVTVEIAQIIEEQGIPRSRTRFETYPGKASGPVRIVFVSTYAKTKPCGDWTRDMTETTTNENYPNLGCAVQSNIAAEIANPGTLVVPKTPGLKDSNTDVSAVQRQQNYVNSVTLPSNYSYAN